MEIRNSAPKLFIGSCVGVRNNERGLFYVLPNIEKLCNFFVNSEITSIDLLFCFDSERLNNKSENNCYNIIKNFKNKLETQKIISNGVIFEIKVEILLNDKPISKIRTENIANARNKIFDYVKEKNKEQNSRDDLFIMLDSNEFACIGDMNLDVLEYYLSKEQIELWDSLSFHREAGDYDMWALSINPFLWSLWAYPNAVQVLDMMNRFFKNVMDEAILKDKLIEVYSAFNGFAIYKVSKFYNCSYSHLPYLPYFDKDILNLQDKLVNSNRNFIGAEGECEHRNFHLEAIYKNGARIRIAPRSLFKKVKNPPPGLRHPA